MPKTEDPNPRQNLLKASPSSPMKFMQEELVYDPDVDGLVRFRNIFEMPKWDGVEDNEGEYEVDDSWIRLDILANRYYGDPTLWWVIAARNHIDLPTAQLYRGRVLRIPSHDWVQTILLPQSLSMVGS
jgi:hypothetical protein